MIVICTAFSHYYGGEIVFKKGIGTLLREMVVVIVLLKKLNVQITILLLLTVNENTKTKSQYSIISLIL
jgi:hypothetical protein